MRLVMLVPTLLLVTIPAQVGAQVSDAELNRRVAAAQGEDPGLPELVQGAAAARLMGNHDMAEEILDEAAVFLNGATGAVVNEMMADASNASARRRSAC